MILTPRQRAILVAFRSIDPAGEFQYNHWYRPLSQAVEGAIVAARHAGATCSVGGWQRDLTSLTKRGALLAEGRGVDRQWGISKDGLAAIEDVPS